jgi:predicted nucleotidyltransferase component of viral defense system
MNQLEFLRHIKTIALAAMASDDRLMEELVLKGGNALDLAYGVSTRASVDLDFSMGEDFESVDLLKARIERCLVDTFRDEGFAAFDVVLSQRPPSISDDLKDFWGGYQVEFKVISLEEYRDHSGSLEELRRHAKVVGEDNSKKFKIDISKNEYRGSTRFIEVSGLQVSVYTPEMIICEKLRAICQQMPEYSQIVKRLRRPATARARDFFDIHAVCEKFGTDFQTDDFRSLLRKVFEVKRVPIRLLASISDYRGLHQPDFISVKATVKAGIVVREFDFYFDFVVDKCRALESLWKEDFPF